VPLAPEVIVIQLELLAVQEQVLPAVTVKLPVPPAEVYEALEDESAYVQVAAVKFAVRLTLAEGVKL
jgi:hypothetical protein